MSKERTRALKACEDACAAMRKAMRALEDLSNADEFCGDPKVSMQLAEFADHCLQGGEMAVDVVAVLGAPEPA